MRYARLLSRLYNTPLAISQAKLDVITSQVTMKLLAGESVPALNADSAMYVDHAATESAKPADKTAVIKVFDSLVAKNGSGDSGVTSYESINRQIVSAVADGASKIVFYIDSPGGEVAGLFGLAKTINGLKDQGIETIAVSDGMITSAAYVIAAACSKVLATSSTIVGSIGVIMTLVNTSAADKRQGYKYEIIRSKDEKALLNPHEPFSSKGIEDAVKMLGTLDTIMNETVNGFRPQLSVEDIITLNGNTVLGEEALQLGLIDGVVESYSEALATVTSGASAKSKTSKISSTTSGANMSVSTLEEALAENIRLSSELEATKQKVALGIAQGKADEQARILGVLEAAETFKLPQATAIKRIKAGTSIADSVEMFESIKEAIQMSNPVGTESFSGTVQHSLNQPQANELDALVAKMENLGKNSDATDDFAASQNLLNIVR